MARIELEQKSTRFLVYATELRNPNFAAMAEATWLSSSSGS